VRSNWRRRLRRQLPERLHNVWAETLCIGGGIGIAMVVRAMQ
jgi:acetyl-CoA acetyltransferase